MVESNIDVIEEILTDLQNNEFSSLTSWNICKARKGIQYIQKYLPELKSIPFIVDFFYEHVSKKEWMKETEIMNHVKDTQLEDAKKEIEIYKTCLRELKQQGLEPRVKSTSSFRSSNESLNHLPSTLGLIKTIVEEEESKERLYNMTNSSSSSLYIKGGNDETLASLRKQIQERNQTFRVMEEKLQNCEQIFTHFREGQALLSAGSDQKSDEMKTEEEKLKESNTDLLNRQALLNAGSDQGSDEMKKLTEEEKLKESNTDLLNRGHLSTWFSESPSNGLGGKTNILTEDRQFFSHIF